MHDTPTIDTTLIPGIRRLWFVGRTVPTLDTIFFASSRIAARSVIRTLYFASDADLLISSLVTLRLAFNDTLSPAAADFSGTGLILPDMSAGPSDLRFGAEPQASAHHLAVNWQLPNRQSRLIAEVLNSSTSAAQIVLRLVIDGLSRTGDQDGLR